MNIRQTELLRPASSTYQVDPRWGGWAIEHVLHPAILIGVPVATLAVTVGIVARAFAKKNTLGIRAFAAALLPFIIVVFVFVYDSELFSSVASRGGVFGFLVSLAVGFAIPYLKKIEDPATSTTLGAFCGSASFSALVFGYAAVQDSRVFVFYYGFTIGTLSHVVLVGFD